MKIVIFGLTISSSWGNGHATVWRGLCRALARRGHRVVFFERDVPYYASNRDLPRLPYADLELYPDWESVLPKAYRHLADADVAMVTSYCPDSISATALVQSSAVPVATFYDLDTPVTLDRLRAGEAVSYIGPDGLRGFDLVLSFTGGPALHALQAELGATRVAPLYGSVDSAVHCPAAPLEPFRGDLSYLGTYAQDRQETLERLFIEPARRLRQRKFIMGGAQYPESFPWTDNIFFVRHLPPADHAAFYCSSRLTLNVTRGAMASMGFCPSGRLFEAAACGAAILSDWWEGLDEFFEPGREILVAQTTEEAVQAIELSDAELRAVAEAGHRRVLAEHTAEHRAEQLEGLLLDCAEAVRESPREAMAASTNSGSLSTC